ncbi:MAG: ABC transporter permease [Blastomonas sp. CACIA14H2]|uniref:ABC transporter permease n=1 Tax=Blastomonas sp. CACIA14H2 TaxID=1419876 RepID=UPI0003D062DE|nr:MAG: ABC transporter permease [Blastomonas sp. CACIA14H2]
MMWIAIRMLTGDRVKFYGMVFGVAFSTLLITQQLTIFVNLLLRGAAAVHEIPSADIWVMDPAGRTSDVTLPMPSTDLQRVRGVPGVDWAVPLIRSGANVRTPDGALEPVTVIGLDDATLTGLPRKLLMGQREMLFEPDAVFIDAVGARKLFGEDAAALGVRLELNDQRAVIRGLVDAEPTFTSGVMLYTRYSNALNYVPGTRNRLSFVLARSDAGEDAATVARRIEAVTGLRARTSQQFAEDGVDYIIDNTGIPINFGITVALGVIVGIAIVGLTFSLFIRDNIKQFGALKAIGVTNARIRQMVVAQSALVALIGYGLGLIMAVAFLEIGGYYSDAFKGFYTPYQIPLIAAAVVALMILITGFVALRQVLKAEPAEVFR